jgi:hypothetical protein
MICGACANAGELNEDGRSEAAKRWHKNCLYPESCTCQHRLGEGNVSEEAKGNGKGNSLPREVSGEGRA